MRLPLHCPGWSVLLLACLSCGGPARVEPEVLRVGVLVDRDTPGGPPSENAARMAADDVNEAGGLIIGGKPYRVELIIRDTLNSPTGAMEAARALVYQDQVAAVIGPNVSRNAVPAAGICDHARVPMIAGGSTNPDTTRSRPFVFRAAFVDSYQGCIMARFAHEELNASSAAVLYDEANDSNRLIAGIFSNVFQKLGGRITAEPFTPPARKIFQARRLASPRADPTCCFCPTIPRT